MSPKNDRQTTWPQYLLALLCGAAVLVADRVTKWLVARRFALGESKPFITGLLDFVYVRNSGGAWGMLSGKTAVLLLVTAAIMVLCVLILVKFSKSSPLLLWAIVLVLSGGIGNMIDRLRQGYVVDFLYFKLINFPVFNVADCYVVISVVIFVMLLLFYYNDDDLKEFGKRITPGERAGKSETEGTTNE